VVEREIVQRSTRLGRVLDTYGRKFQNNDHER
jgi:hypothetical protein